VEGEDTVHFRHAIQEIAVRIQRESFPFEVFGRVGQLRFVHLDFGRKDGHRARFGSAQSRCPRLYFGDRSVGGTRNGRVLPRCVREDVQPDQQKKSALDGDTRARAVGSRIEAALREAGLTPPDVRTLATDGLSRKELIDVLGVLEREGRVVRVAPDLYYARAAIDRGIALLREYCAEHGEITAAAFRDLIQASRKYSIALLDYCDRTGVTLRVGDVRRVR